MFRVCLFGGEIWWMKNYEEKMERKIFRSMFGWVEREENKLWNPSVFSLGPPKSFLPKMERKLKRKIGHLFLDKNSHVRLHMGLSTLLCFTLFSFFFFLFLSSWLLPHLLFIYIFWFTEQASYSSVHILFFLLLSFVFFFFLFLFFF